MSIYVALVLAAVLAVCGLLWWAVGKHEDRRERGGERRLDPVEVPGGHVMYLPQMRQALQEEDFAFLASKGFSRLSRAVKRERTTILLQYLDATQEDFRKLLRLARVIAVLSPEIAPTHEWERLRLTVWFGLHRRLVRMRLQLGLVALPQLNELARHVSDLTMRIEMAMTQLGERAALASEIASTLRA